MTSVAMESSAQSQNDESTMNDGRWTMHASIKAKAESERGGGGGVRSREIFWRRAPRCLLARASRVQPKFQASTLPAGCK